MKAQPCEVSTYAKSRKDIGVSDPTPGSFPRCQPLVSVFIPSHTRPLPDKALPFSPKVQSHVWVRGGCDSGRCDRCQKKIRIYHSLTGLHCVWCHLEVGAGAVFSPPRPVPPRPAQPRPRPRPEHPTSLSQSFLLPRALFPVQTLRLRTDKASCMIYSRFVLLDP